VFDYPKFVEDIYWRIVTRFILNSHPFRRIDFSCEKLATLDDLKKGPHEGFYTVNHDVFVLNETLTASSEVIRIFLGEPHIVFPPFLVRSVGIRRSENLDDLLIN